MLKTNMYVRNWIITTLLLVSDNIIAQDDSTLYVPKCHSDTATIKIEPNEKHHKWFDGNFYTEVNYGSNFFGNNRNIYDFPHAVLELNIHLGRGWSLRTEQEFEYLSDSGDWPTHFSDMYSCNWAYVEKEFSTEALVLAGVLNIPVGLVSSSYGSGLTIYDPLSEGRVIPLKWHETAIAFTGCIRSWEYWIGLLAHIDTFTPDEENIGLAGRINWRPNDNVRIGVSGFVGKGLSHGIMVQNESEKTWYNISSIDYDYDRERWISSGSVIYRSEDHDVALGAELGYRATKWIIPFVGFDMVTSSHLQEYEVLTLGVNVMPIKGFTIKTQLEKNRDLWRMDMSLGYTVDF